MNTGGPEGGNSNGKLGSFDGLASARAWHAAEAPPPRTLSSVPRWALPPLLPPLPTRLPMPLLSAGRILTRRKMFYA